MDKKFIDNDSSKGLLYDYKKVNKLYKSLNTPKDYFNPTHLPFDKASYFHLLSIRGTGKTTNLILWGMCCNIEYGTVLVYARQVESHIMPKFTNSLFSVIVENGYIEKLTNGEYNNVTYKSRRFYYSKTDENGQIEKLSPTYFMLLVAVEKYLDYKSTINEPFADIVIYDEYISDIYRQNEFTHFLQLLSTLFRDRESCKVFCLANNVNADHIYYTEFEIYKELQTMDFGDWKIIKSTHGTNNYVEIVKTTVGKDKKREVSKNLYFGFNNPQLASITGSRLWATKDYQKIPSNKELYNEDDNGDQKETVDNILDNYYLQYLGKIIRLRLVYSSIYGLMVLCTKANHIYKDSVVYSLENIENKNSRYGIGYDELDKLLWTCYGRNQFYYQNNGVGNFIDNYISQVKGKKINV